MQANNPNYRQKTDYEQQCRAIEIDHNLSYDDKFEAFIAICKALNDPFMGVRAQLAHEIPERPNALVSHEIFYAPGDQSLPCIVISHCSPVYLP